jgi:hypothetical protein
VGGRGEGDAPGGGDAARAGHVGLDVVDGAGVEDAVELLGERPALPAGQRDVRRPVEGGVPVDLRGRERLLEEVDVEVGQPLGHAAGVRGVVGVVGVGHQSHVVADGVADRPDEFDVALRSPAEVVPESDLVLQGVEAGVDVAGGLLDDGLAQRLEVVDARPEVAGRVGAHRFPTPAAEEPRHRLAGRPAVEVPQRDVDAADDPGVGGGVELVREQRPQVVVDRLHVARVAPLEPRGDHALDEFAVAGDGPPALAPADRPVVGRQADETVLAPLDPLLCVGERFVQAPPERDGLDRLDAHGWTRHSPGLGVVPPVTASDGTCGRGRPSRQFYGRPRRPSGRE